MGLKYYGVKQFYLLGDEHASKRELDIGVPKDMEDLQYGIATEYTIVKPEGMPFKHWTGFLLILCLHRRGIPNSKRSSRHS
jgi:hypothetical protein